MAARKPVVLCILDGWGLGEFPQYSAPAQAQVPHFNRIWAESPHATLTTFGPDVGLPSGQMGNSEVGHTNIGAGRVVAMDLGAIDLAVEDGSFAQNPELLDFVAKLKASGGTAHLMGVVSDGGSARAFEPRSGSLPRDCGPRRAGGRCTRSPMGAMWRLRRRPDLWNN